MNDANDRYPGFEPQPMRKRQREPAFNLPPVVVVLALVIIAIHAIRTYLLTSDQNHLVMLNFSFIPAYFTFPLDQVPYPMARYWSAVTYAFLHANWTHVFVNLLWMIAFGSAVAKRLGAGRFMLFSFFSVIAGAVAHFLAYPGDVSPVIGASAGVAAYMGAASRFIMGPSGIGTGAMQPEHRYRAPGLSLMQTLTNRNVLIFVGVWMAFNFLIGSGVLPVGGGDAPIAWQAHVGGFLFGLLSFSLFDPYR